MESQMKQLFVTFAIAVGFLTAPGAQAESATGQILGKVYYTGKIGFFSKTSEYKIEAKTPTVSVYSGNDVLLFDSKTFVIVHIKNAPDNFEPSIQASDSAGVLEVGNKWTAKYKQPATRQSQCNTPSEQELNATVAAREIESIDVGGVKTDVEVFIVHITGTWSSCGFNGPWKATRKYAPTLGIFTLTDSETQLDGRVISVGSMKIDHIER
jgi:hypothetical protein